MNITPLPSSNEYLNLGFGMLNNINSQKKNVENIIIINIDACNIMEIVLSSWVESLKIQKILIVTDKRMLPLANYYWKTNDNVIGVCDKSESLERISEMNNSTSVKKHSMGKAKPCLTQREFLFLRYFLHGVTVKEQSYLCGIGMKTIYTFHQRLLTKFRVKKLRHLTAGYPHSMFDKDSRCNLGKNVNHASV